MSSNRGVIIISISFLLLVHHWRGRVLPLWVLVCIWGFCIISRIISSTNHLECFQNLLKLKLGPHSSAKMLIANSIDHLKLCICLDESATRDHIRDLIDEKSNENWKLESKMQKNLKTQEIFRVVRPKQLFTSTVLVFFFSKVLWVVFREFYQGSPLCHRFKHPFYSKRVLILAKLQSQLDNPCQSRIIIVK